MLPFKIDVSELLDSAGNSVQIDGSYALPTLEVGDESFVLVEPATVDVMLSNAGSGIVATGSVSARVTAACARCLCDFETVIAGSVEGFYVSPGVPREDEVEAELVARDETVDLAPALIAALVVEAPFVPLHTPDCAGLCVECGADLNEGDCGCGEKVDESHPFSALKGLLDEGSRSD